MSIALRQKSVLTIIGSSDILHSLFSTIAVRLEDGQRGSRYPLIMGKLYEGSLPEHDAGAAMQEALAIRTALRVLPPSAVVWDADEPHVLPPAEFAINTDLESAAHYWLTVTGRNLVDELVDNLESAIEHGGSVDVVAFNGGSMQHPMPAPGTTNVVWSSEAQTPARKWAASFPISLAIGLVLILAAALHSMSFSHSCFSDGCIGIVFGVLLTLVLLLVQLLIVLPIYLARRRRAGYKLVRDGMIWTGLSAAAAIIPLLFMKQ